MGRAQQLVENGKKYRLRMRHPTSSFTPSWPEKARREIRGGRRYLDSMDGSARGFPKSRYYDWKQREEQERLEDWTGEVGVSPHAILPEEKQAVVAYALGHPKDGYRRLTWQMIDEDVAYVSPSSVYRILRDADLLYRWKRSERSGEPPPEPTKPNERWHTDLMYLRVEDTWYFLVTVLDAYSRYVVHWELLTTMTAAAVRMVLQDALEKTGANSRRRTSSSWCGTSSSSTSESERTIRNRTGRWSDSTGARGTDWESRS